MKARTMKQIGTALIVIGLAGAYYTIAAMNNRALISPARREALGKLVNFIIGKKKGLVK